MQNTHHTHHRETARAMTDAALAQALTRELMEPDRNRERAAAILEEAASRFGEI